MNYNIEHCHETRVYNIQVEVPITVRGNGNK